MIDAIRDALAAGQSIDPQQAAFLWNEADDDTLCELASLVRARFHPPDEATYLVMAIINYTNVCIAKCDYCSFYRLPGQEGAYLLDLDAVCQRIDVAVGLGASLIGFNGGFHPKLRIQDYADLFSTIRTRYPQIEFYEFTVAEFMYYCKVSKVSYDEGAALLAASGTRWVTGGGSEVLADSFRRRHSPLKYRVDDFYRAQKAILDSGMRSTGTMVIGFDETLDERLEHLIRLRDFQTAVQAEGQALSSFLCWTYKPWHNDLGGHEIGTDEYLRWLAICRIFLHNIPHIRTSVLTKNADALRGLRFGANDFDLPTEDEVTSTAGATISHDFERILDAARDEGFTPIHREPF